MIESEGRSSNAHRPSAGARTGGTRLLLVVGVTVAIALICTQGAAAESAYSPGGWSTLHRGPSNDRAARASVVGRTYSTWTTLEGATVLVAPTLSPDGGTLYVATGRGAGHSNLFAYARDGRELWRTPPWQGVDDSVDPCAVLSSPVVDAAGDVYLGDCNQMWAFHPSGVVKWVVPLPAPQDGDWVPVPGHPVNAFTTAVLTRSGHVAGVTNFGDVAVFDRNDGRMLNRPYRLPGLVPPASDAQPLPDSLFGDGLLDPRFREWAWQLIFGGRMRSANTPAITDGDRLFVVGSGGAEGQGALYALDLEAGDAGVRVRPVFATPIGLGSGSSPAIAPDGSHVYVSDEEGWLYAVDADSGEIAWKRKTFATAAAAAVGRDGTVYVLQADAPAIAAVRPNGELAWESDFGDLGEAWPSSFWLGDAVAVGNGNPTVTEDALLVAATRGYRIWLGRSVVLPVSFAVVALDLETGEAIRDVVALPDGSDGITVVLEDGTLINSLGAAISSAVSPLAPFVNWMLPGDKKLAAPRGGVQFATPTGAR